MVDDAPDHSTDLLATLHKKAYHLKVAAAAAATVWAISNLHSRDMLVKVVCVVHIGLTEKQGADK